MSVIMALVVSMLVCGAGHGKTTIPVFVIMVNVVFAVPAMARRPLLCL